jgi:transcriptional regulator with XRE-family HTH domain
LNGAPSPLGAPTCAEPLSVVLGRRLRRLRGERGWSRQTVATRVGLPVRRVGEHERGTRDIEPRELVAYIRLYRVSIGTLFSDLPTGGNGEPAPRK